MSFHVDLEYVNFNQDNYNLSFIILKNPKSPILELNSTAVLQSFSRVIFPVFPFLLWLSMF